MNEPTHFTRMQESWEPPPELSGPTPRQLKWTSGGVANLVLAFLIVVLGFGIVGAIYGAADQDHRLKQEGQETDAIVRGKWTVSGRSTGYKVAYEFSAGGQTLRGESQIPHSRWQGLSAGSHIPVKYVPSEPTINRASAAFEQVALLPYWVPLAAFLFWIWMVYLAVSQIRKEKRLLKYGQAAAGIITNTPKRVFRGPPRYGYVIQYEFQLPDGPSIKGKTQRDAWYQAGRPVCVLYDPRHPRRNSIYPLRLCRVRQ